MSKIQVFKLITLFLLLLGFYIFTFGSFILAQSDTDAPHLVSVKVTPEIVIDTGLSAQPITFTFHITDDLSGGTGEGTISSAFFKSPSGSQSLIFGIHESESDFSGTPQDGVYTVTKQIPQYAETGLWVFDYLILIDDVGNRRDLTRSDLVPFQADFVIEAINSDTTAPYLVEIKIEPTIVTSISQSMQPITFTFHITDDLSGGTGEGTISTAFFKSPSGSQSLIFGIHESESDFSGTPQDGVYTVVCRNWIMGIRLFDSD